MPGHPVSPVDMTPIPGPPRIEHDVALLPDIASLTRNLAFVERRQRNYTAGPAQFVVLFATDARPSVILHVNTHSIGLAGWFRCRGWSVA